jgi:hypothetical protein
VTFHSRPQKSIQERPNINQFRDYGVLALTLTKLTIDRALKNKLRPTLLSKIKNIHTTLLRALLYVVRKKGVTLYNMRVRRHSTERRSFSLIKVSPALPSRMISFGDLSARRFVRPADSQLTQIATLKNKSVKMVNLSPVLMQHPGSRQG